MYAVLCDDVHTLHRLKKNVINTCIYRTTLYTMQFSRGIKYHDARSCRNGRKTECDNVKRRLSVNRHHYNTGGRDDHVITINLYCNLYNTSYGRLLRFWKCTLIVAIVIKTGRIGTSLVSGRNHTPCAERIWGQLTLTISMRTVISNDDRP